MKKLLEKIRNLFKKSIKSNTKTLIFKFNDQTEIEVILDNHVANEWLFDRKIIKDISKYGTVREK